MIGTRYFSGGAFEDKAGYSRAVIDPPYVHVAGTTGFDTETGEFPPDVESQCENCFKIIGEALAAAGTTMENLVRIRVYITKQEYMERIIPILKKHCDAARPANTAIICGLIDDRMLVEIEATAKIPE